MLGELAGGHADHTWEKRMRELIRPDVLVLDDFAMRQLTAAQADGLYELVSERQGRSLILTSNRAPGDWYPGHRERPQPPTEQASLEPRRQAPQIFGQLNSELRPARAVKPAAKR
ncbi:ATP-binding protein [Streptomyces sp. NPDC051917]|uniref:ATP-binding protein n=1 Tax=Streptomyces sp. NPDC051917 TaxID=3154754 RepID=UPI00344F9FE2